MQILTFFKYGSINNGKRHSDLDLHVIIPTQFIQLDIESSMYTGIEAKISEIIICHV